MAGNCRPLSLGIIGRHYLWVSQPMADEQPESQGPIDEQREEQSDRQQSETQGRQQPQEEEEEEE